MHAVFLLYGHKPRVDDFIMDVMAQKFPLKLWRNNPETGVYEERLGNWVQCQLRILPGGIYEIVFPKEFMAPVLTTLGFNKMHSDKKGEGNPIADFDINREISIMGFKFKPINFIKKELRIEDPGEFKTEESLLWLRDFVTIIPLGIRHELGD